MYICTICSLERNVVVKYNIKLGGCELHEIEFALKTCAYECLYLMCKFVRMRRNSYIGKY